MYLVCGRDFTISRKIDFATRNIYFYNLLFAPEHSPAYFEELFILLDLDLEMTELHVDGQVFVEQNFIFFGHCRDQRLSPASRHWRLNIAPKSLGY